MDETSIFLGLGSNLGDREQNLRNAIEALSHHLTIDAVSSLYETPPYGPPDQPLYLNLALSAHTTLAPEDLLQRVKSIERKLGRIPTYRWGPRVVDIDILLYDDVTVDRNALVIPHRDMTNRAFVLVPLAEIAPNILHPGVHRTIRELRNAIDARDVHPYGPAPTVTRGPG